MKFVCTNKTCSFTIYTDLNIKKVIFVNGKHEQNLDTKSQLNVETIRTSSKRKTVVEDNNMSHQN